MTDTNLSPGSPDRPLCYAARRWPGLRNLVAKSVARSVAVRRLDKWRSKCWLQAARELRSQPGVAQQEVGPCNLEMGYVPPFPSRASCSDSCSPAFGGPRIGSLPSNLKNRI